MASALSRWCVLVAALMLAGCGLFGRSDGAPARKLDPSSIDDAVPKREPITKAGNKSPYTVLGKTYSVLPTAKGYRMRGTASWYGTKFHGESTSNGERYDLYGMTAAHCTLPIPTYVQVTNLENGKQCIVRVNDRGPFEGGRLIDLSYAAAVKLGYAHKGTALVEVTAIDVDNWPPSPALAVDKAPSSALVLPVAEAAPLNETVSVPPPAAPGQGQIYVQAGAFGSRAAADNVRARLAGLQSLPVQVQQAAATPVLYRVRIGPLRDRAAAQQLCDELLSKHISAARIVDDAAP